jgi:hypothetical protein
VSGSKPVRDDTVPHAAALRRIAENQQFINAKRNERFVMMEYFGYLRRDSDAGGYAFWLYKLNEFDGTSNARKWSRRSSTPVNTAIASSDRPRKNASPLRV